MHSHRGVSISEKTAEYFLFLFKALQMHPEAIDLCENFSEMVETGNDKHS